MFALGLGLTNGCCETFPEEKISSKTKKMNSTAKIVVITSVVEALIIITTLVVGILGALHILSMHAALAYSLIGVGSLLTAGWIVISALTKGQFLIGVTKYFLYGLGCIDKIEK